MGLEEHEIEIKDRKYKVKQLGSKHADLVFVRFMKLAAPALKAFDVEEPDSTTLFDVMVDAIFRTASSIDPGEAMWLRDEMLKCSFLVQQGEANGGVVVPVEQPMTQIYDGHFRGQQADRLRLLSFALQVNFADFLGASAIRKLLAIAGRKAPQSTSPPEPAGSSSG